MSDKKIIAVVGATGAQGGGLVRAILDDPNGGFSARAITRDVSSDQARALADRGAEVVAADIDDEASLAAALQGAYGAFFVTFCLDSKGTAGDTSFWNSVVRRGCGIACSTIAAARPASAATHDSTRREAPAPRQR